MDLLGCAFFYKFYLCVALVWLLNIYVTRVFRISIGGWMGKHNMFYCSYFTPRTTPEEKGKKNTTKKPKIPNKCKLGLV